MELSIALRNTAIVLFVLTYTINAMLPERSEATDAGLSPAAQKVLQLLQSESSLESFEKDMIDFGHS